MLRDSHSYETQIIDAVRSVNRALGGTYGTSSAIYKNEFNQYEVQLIDAIKGISRTLSGSGISVLAGEGDLSGYATIAQFQDLARRVTVLENESFFRLVDGNITLKEGYRNLWVPGFLAAGGVGTGSSGGVTYLKQLSDVYHDLNGVLRANGDPVTAGDALVYDSTLGWVASPAGGGGGSGTVTGIKVGTTSYSPDSSGIVNLPSFVTSVGMTVPTGLTVTGTPITGSGTLAVTLTQGYTIPTADDVNKGVTAYGWGDHSQAGYATQTWVQQQNYLVAGSVYTLRTPVTGTAANGTLLGVDALSNASTSTAGSDTTRIEWDSSRSAWHVYGNLYADGWVAAGGIGSSTSGTYLKLLNDVYHNSGGVLRANGTAVVAGDTLVYNTSLGWVAAPMSGGASYLKDLGDVSVVDSSRATGDVLSFDHALGKWTNVRKSTYLSGYLPLTGGTLTGDLIMSNSSIYIDGGVIAGGSEQDYDHGYSPWAIEQNGSASFSLSVTTPRVQGEDNLYIGHSSNDYYVIVQEEMYLAGVYLSGAESLSDALDDNYSWGISPSGDAWFQNLTIEDGHIDLGPVRLVYDSQAMALRVTTNVSGNNRPTIGLYADGFVAAGGYGSSASGGSIVTWGTSTGTMRPLSVNGDTETVLLSGALSGYATQTWVWDSLTNNTEKPDVKINAAHIPIASTSAIGGVKVDGTTITISNGVISAVGGGSSFNGGEITNDLWLHTNSANYGSTLYFGDKNGATGYAYIKEDTDDHLTIYAASGITLSVGTGASVSIPSLSVALGGLSDVSLSSPSNGQALVYRNGSWVNETIQGGGGGSVTSVGLSMPTGFSVTNTPVTSSGTLTVAFASGYSLPTTTKQGQWDDDHTLLTGSQAKNLVFASPATASGAPSFRALVAADLPDLSSKYVTIDTAQTITGAKTFSATIVATAGMNSSDAVNFLASGNKVGQVSAASNWLRFRVGSNISDGTSSSYKQISFHNSYGLYPEQSINLGYNSSAGRWATIYGVNGDLSGDLTLSSSSHIDIGPMRLEYANNALHITKKSSSDTTNYGMYADGFVAGGGVGSGSSDAVVKYVNCANDSAYQAITTKDKSTIYTVGTTTITKVYLGEVQLYPATS